MVRAILLDIMLKVLPLLGATHKLPRLPHQGQVSRSEHADDQQHEALQDGLLPEEHSARHVRALPVRVEGLSHGP